MKKHFKKFVSILLSIAMTVTYVMPGFAIPTVMADVSQNDMDYALSMMNKFAVITAGDYQNSNHTMAPIAVGGNFSGKMEFNDRGVGYLGNGIDFVVGGSAENGGINASQEKLDLGIFGYTGNGFYVPDSYTPSGSFAISETGSINGNMRVDFYGSGHVHEGAWVQDVPPYSGNKADLVFSVNPGEELPIDFEKIDRGMSEWSDMVNNYCTVGDIHPDDVIYVVADNANIVLEGSDPTLNIFNLDVTQNSNLTNIDFKVPAGSKVIVNVVGTNFFG